MSKEDTVVTSPSGKGRTRELHSAKFGKKDSVFPFSIGVLPINLVYVAFTLIMALFTNCETRTFVMWHGVGFAVTVIAGIVFKMGEHHIEEQSKDDPPAQKIERSDVTWR